MTTPCLARRLVALSIVIIAISWLPGAAAAAPEGTHTIGMHFTPVPRWLDPAEGESTLTPYLLLYALHDGLLKPMPGVGSGPSLAEHVTQAPIYHLGFPIGVGPRLHDIMATQIPGFYMSPYEDLRLRR
jgi:peptide/nickel transport system substrate-binding protein